MTRVRVSRLRTWQPRHRRHGAMFPRFPSTWRRESNVQAWKLGLDWDRRRVGPPPVSHSDNWALRFHPTPPPGPSLRGGGGAFRALEEPDFSPPPLLLYQNQAPPALWSCDREGVASSQEMHLPPQIVTKRGNQPFVHPFLSAGQETLLRDDYRKAIRCTD